MIKTSLKDAYLQVISEVNNKIASLVEKINSFESGDDGDDIMPNEAIEMFAAVLTELAKLSPVSEDAEKANKFSATMREVSEKALSAANEAKDKGASESVVKAIKDIVGLLKGLKEKYPSPVSKDDVTVELAGKIETVLTEISERSLSLANEADKVKMISPSMFKEFDAVLALASSLMEKYPSPVAKGEGDGQPVDGSGDPADKQGNKTVHAQLAKEKLDAVTKLATEIAEGAGTFEMSELRAKISQLSSLSWQLGDNSEVLQVLEKADKAFNDRLKKEDEKIHETVAALEKRIKTLEESKATSKQFATDHSTDKGGDKPFWSPVIFGKK